MIAVLLLSTILFLCCLIFACFARRFKKETKKDLISLIMPSVKVKDDAYDNAINLYDAYIHDGSGKVDFNFDNPMYTSGKGDTDLETGDGFGSLYHNPDDSDDETEVFKYHMNPLHAPRSNTASAPSPVKRSSLTQTFRAALHGGISSPTHQQGVLTRSSSNFQGVNPMHQPGFLGGAASVASEETSTSATTAQSGATTASGASKSSVERTRRLSAGFVVNPLLASKTQRRASLKKRTSAAHLTALRTLRDEDDTNSTFSSINPMHSGGEKMVSPSRTPDSKGTKKLPPTEAALTVLRAMEVRRKSRGMVVVAPEDTSSSSGNSIHSAHVVSSPMHAQPPSPPPPPPTELLSPIEPIVVPLTLDNLTTLQQSPRIQTMIRRRAYQPGDELKGASTTTLRRLSYLANESPEDHDARRGAFMRKVAKFQHNPLIMSSPTNYPGISRTKADVAKRNEDDFYSL